MEFPGFIRRGKFIVAVVGRRVGCSVTTPPVMFTMFGNVIVVASSGMNRYGVLAVSVVSAVLPGSCIVQTHLCKPSTYTTSLKP